MFRISCIVLVIIGFWMNPMRGFTQEESPKILSVFSIKEAWFGDKNVSRKLRAQKAYTMFYKMGNDSVHWMANVWPKSRSQSFGPMQDIVRENFPASTDAPEIDKLYFTWNYLNSYDLKQGVAQVEVLIEHRDKEAYFIVRILPEDRELIVYKGAMQIGPDRTRARIKEQ